MHDGERNSEEPEYVRADENRYDDQHKAVHGDSPREFGASLVRESARKHQEDGGATQRIDDREQRAHYQQRARY